MDSNWFQEALNRAGQSQADLARYLALAPSAVSRMLKGERQMKLHEAVQTAAFLGVSQEEVLRHAGEPSTVPPSTEPARRGRPPRAAPAFGLNRQDPLPIRGAARGGNDQEMFLGDEPIGYTPRPSNLAGVRDAYAVYVVGDALSPRYEQGWLLHVHPHKPAARGRDVVVLKRDGELLIRQFVGWEDEVLVLRQLKPEGTIKLPRNEVAECHLVVGVDQEG